MKEKVWKIKNKIRLRTLLRERCESDFILNLNTGEWKIYEGEIIDSNLIKFNYIKIETNEEDNEEMKFIKSIIKKSSMMIKKLEEIGRR